ncbi:hypothetical protein RP20_CCG008520 [Aedes albopictus]|nr:hypothetical protein RP20_CCG008520 [Aedes albopictus]
MAAGDEQSRAITRIVIPDQYATTFERLENNVALLVLEQDKGKQQPPLDEEDNSVFKQTLFSNISRTAGIANPIPVVDAPSTTRQQAALGNRRNNSSPPPAQHPPSESSAPSDKQSHPFRSLATVYNPPNLGRDLASANDIPGQRTAARVDSTYCQYLLK